MKTAKHHHTLSQLILRRFATEDEAIELVDREPPHKVIPTYVPEALARKNFYSVKTPTGRDVSMETFLAQTVETPAREAFNRLIELDRPIGSAGIRRDICRFLAYQIVRGPGYREELVAAARAFAAREGMPPVSTDDESKLHIRNMPEVAEQMAWKFNARRWRLLAFDRPVLVTSDEPVAFIGEDRRAVGANGGVMTAREVVFPIGARHALQMFRPDIEVEEGRRSGTPEDAKVFNLHVAYGAHRFIARYPGTDPLRGVVFPKREDPIAFVDGIILSHPNATKEQRDRRWREVRREVRKKETAGKRSRGR